MADFFLVAFIKYSTRTFGKTGKNQSQAWKYDIECRRNSKSYTCRTCPSYGIRVVDRRKRRRIQKFFFLFSEVFSECRQITVFLFATFLSLSKSKKFIVKRLIALMMELHEAIRWQSQLFKKVSSRVKTLRKCCFIKLNIETF